MVNLAIFWTTPAAVQSHLPPVRSLQEQQAKELHGYRQELDSLNARLLEEDTKLRNELKTMDEAAQASIAAKKKELDQCLAISEAVETQRQELQANLDLILVSVGGGTGLSGRTEEAATQDGATTSMAEDPVVQDPKAAQNVDGDVPEQPTASDENQDAADSEPKPSSSSGADCPTAGETGKSMEHEGRAQTQRRTKGTTKPITKGSRSTSRRGKKRC